MGGGNLGWTHGKWLDYVSTPGANSSRGAESPSMWKQPVAYFLWPKEWRKRHSQCQWWHTTWLLLTSVHTGVLACSVQQHSVRRLHSGHGSDVRKSNSLSFFFHESWSGSLWILLCPTATGAITFLKEFALVVDLSCNSFTRAQSGEVGFFMPLLQIFPMLTYVIPQGNMWHRLPVVTWSSRRMSAFSSWDIGWRR